MNMRIDRTCCHDVTFSSYHFGRHTHNHVGRYTFHDIGVTGFTDAADSSSLNADIGFVNACPIDH